MAALLEKAANISTRARVGNSEAVEIGGFVIQGTARKNVLIRALGPSIQNGGTPLPGTLVDPVLELHDATARCSLSMTIGALSCRKQF